MSHTLRNGRGMRVEVNTHNASLLSWQAPDRYGRMADVLAAVPLAAPSLTGWWCTALGEASMLLQLAHEGRLLALHFQLDGDGTLHIEGDAIFLPAPCFNLQGHGAGVGDHVLRLAASRYFPGAVAQAREVAGSAFDFRQPAPLGARLVWPELAGAPGFAHDFCLAGTSGLHEAARVSDPASGRILRFSSTLPALHLRSDGGCFCLASPRLGRASGSTLQASVAYRLGVQDMDVFDISEAVSMMLNK
ncbi:hypothetical protein [Janthinobacterium sp. HLX7-2]|uniref:aldose epimerase family protein n=1 Tax=Janthinobacterium sp. HLX7-2 TaxID=1259331 RepID=UPI003F218863